MPTVPKLRNRRLQECESKGIRIGKGKFWELEYMEEGRDWYEINVVWREVETLNNGF